MESFDAAANQVKIRDTGDPVKGGFGEFGLNKGRRFFYLNVPEELDAPGEFFWELTLEPREGERVWRKTTKDVFESNPDLAGWLRDQGITELDVIGLQSEMCVRSSTLGARSAGFTASPVPGLHGTYPEGTHDESGPTGVTAAELSARVDAELA
jgi:nicotinamidase-related amidase